MPDEIFRRYVDLSKLNAAMSGDRRRYAKERKKNVWITQRIPCARIETRLLLVRGEARESRHLTLVPFRFTAPHTSTDGAGLALVMIGAPLSFTVTISSGCVEVTPGGFNIMGVPGQFPIFTSLALCQSSCDNSLMTFKPLAPNISQKLQEI